MKSIFAASVAGAVLLWGVAIGAPRRSRHRAAGAVRLLASPPPQVNTELNPIRKYHEVMKPARLDQWTIIGPGGGGTFYHPAISPHDPNLVFTTTDMTQCYVSENGGRTWRQFNLRMTCRITFDPKLPNRVYALASNVGLWRSDDRGHGWRLVYPDPATTPVPLYLDDEAEVLLKSTKGYPGGMAAFAIDPADSATLYAIAASELRVSHDGGGHWQVLANRVNGANIYVDPNSPPEKRVLITTGGGDTGIWDGTKYNGPLKVPYVGWVSGWGFGSSRITGRSTLYAATDFIVKDGALKGGGVLATEDGGQTWRSLNEGFLKMVAPGTYPEFTAIATGPHHPEIVYAAVSSLFLPNDPKPYFGVVKTTDGGATWSVVTAESDQNAANMHDSWLGYRFGPDWGDQPLGMALGPNDSELVYRTDLGRVMRSVDGGKNWEAVYSQGTDNGYTTTGLDVTTCYGIHFDPFDPKRMFISYTDIGLFRSEDGGESWISSTARGVPREWINSTYWVEFDPAVKGRMWAVMSGMHDLPRIRMFRQPGSTRHAKGGVVFSSDGGRTWARSSEGLPEMAATHILLDPKSPPAARVLYVAGFGHGVFKSVDGGRSWTAKNSGLPQTEPLAWRMAMDRNGTLYVVTIRRAADGKLDTERDGAVYRSSNGAESWERINLPAGVNGPVSVTIDPEDASRLYLSAWARYTPAAGVNPPDGGVYLSTDAGRTWSNVLNGSRRIYDVTVDPRNANLVYAAGFDASAWRSADRGKTWKRIRGFNFKDGHRIVPDPADPSKIYIATFGSSVWHGPAEGDPNAVEDVVAPPSMTYAAPLYAK